MSESHEDERAVFPLEVPLRESGIWMDATASSPELLREVVDSLRDRLGALRGTLVLGGKTGTARVAEVRSRAEAADLGPTPSAAEVLESLHGTDDRIVTLAGRGIAVPLRARLRGGPDPRFFARRRRFPVQPLDRLVGCLYFDGFPGEIPEPAPDPGATAVLAGLVSMLLGGSAFYRSAATDPDTGLRTPLFLGRFLEEELAIVRESRTPLSLLLADVDGMRTSFLRHGPAVAAGIVAGVGEEIRRGLRGTDVGIRTGGQSFALLLPETDVEGAAVVAEKIRFAVERRVWPKGLHVTLSLGFASFPEQAEDAEELIARAGRALRRAKSEGRNRWIAWRTEAPRAGRPELPAPRSFLLADPEGRDLERMVSLLEYLGNLATGGLAPEEIASELLARAVLAARADRGALVIPSQGRVVLATGGPPDWPSAEVLGEIGEDRGGSRLLDPTTPGARAWVPVTADGEAGILLERSGGRIHTAALHLLAFLARVTPGIRETLPVPGAGAVPGGSHGFPGIVGESPAMQKVYDLLRRVARSRMHVLLVGETGTGKELIARAIHRSSSRARGPFITVDCGALAPTLAESELFGHRKGSFTDAREDRVGLFERAQGGTLFLDEVAGIPVELQTRLLRVLQEGEIRRVGDVEYRPVEVRVLAASNRDLRAEVAAGRMREDLYYRLNGIMILVPPLRERKEDIPLLVSWFLRQRAAEGGSRSLRLDASAFEALLNYAWPGNVRELENVIGKACLLSEGEVLTAAHLPEEVVRSTPGRTAAPVPRTNEEFKRAREELIRDLTRRFLMAALHEHGGNISRAAEATGLQRTYVHRMLRDLGIDPGAFKSRRTR